MSLVGDPGMKSDGLRVAFEAWNSCNEVAEEAPGMGSPRAADCFDLSIDWISYCMQELDSDELIKIFSGARWIWWNRNKIRHDNEEVDISLAVSKVRCMVNDFTRANYMFVVSRPEAGDRWAAPEEGRFKITCDGAWNPNSNEGGIGVICRDSKGVIEFVAATPLDNQYSILEVECAALRLGMELARKESLCKVTFHSDNVEVVQALLANSSSSKMGSWLDDCR
ncbi:hypothetical protein QQ045_004471 [Rhodiola kirilowii]